MDNMNIYLNFLHNFIHYDLLLMGTNIKLMSCKFIKDKYFICGLFVWSKLYISSFKINNDLSIGILLSGYLSEYVIFDSISSLGLYDTDINNIKLLPLQNNKDIRCDFLNITKNEKCSYELIDDDNIVFNTSNDFKEKNCYFSEFDNKYLLWCGNTNFIKCYNINIDNYDKNIMYGYYICIRKVKSKANLIYY